MGLKAVVVGGRVGCERGPGMGARAGNASVLWRNKARLGIILTVLTGRLPGAVTLDVVPVDIDLHMSLGVKVTASNKRRQTHCFGPFIVFSTIPLIPFNFCFNSHRDLCCTLHRKSNTTIPAWHIDYLFVHSDPRALCDTTINSEKLVNGINTSLLY